MKNRYQLLTGLIFCCLISYAQGPIMFKGNAAQTGEYPGKPIRALKGVRFSFRTEGPIRSSVAYANGLIFFGSSDGNLYALNETSGTEAWRFKTNGEVHSSPAVFNGNVFFTSRDGNFYIVSAKDGKLVFKYTLGKDIDYPNGWDYFLSSPVISQNTVFLGSGDGYLYSFDATSQKLNWKFNVGARIRTSPAISNDAVFVAGFNGFIYGVNKISGKEKWKFATDGVNLDFQSVGYDRTSILGSPSYRDGLVTAGGRDGFFYGLDATTGKLKWKVDHEGSWVLATAMSAGYAYAGSGSSRFVQKVDMTTGKELWNYRLDAATFSAIGLGDSVLYTTDYAGTVYGINTITGLPYWKFSTGRRCYTTPVAHNNTLYFGADDGYLYALEGSAVDRTYVKPKKIVFYEPDKSDKTYTWYRKGLDVLIRDYFISAGYELMNSEKLIEFMTTYKPADAPSVVVFATTIAPPAMRAIQHNPVRSFLDKGGKVVFPGPNPFAFQTVEATGQVDSINFQANPKIIFDVDFVGAGNINMDACYTSHPTREGALLGLRGFWTGYGSVAPHPSIRALSIDQFGKISCWIKNYGGREGTGMMQLMIAKELTGFDISSLRPAIEYGIEW